MKVRNGGMLNLILLLFFSLACISVNTLRRKDLFHLIHFRPIRRRSNRFKSVAINAFQSE